MERKMFIATFVLAFLIGLVVGACHNYPVNTTASKAWEEVEEYKLRDFSQATRLANAYRDMLKSYYHYKDYEEYDITTDTYEGKHNFWDDCITESEAYDIANEILQGDWGDFFDE